MIKTRETNFAKCIVSHTATITTAINNLNLSGLKIVICTDESGKIVGTITDGDIRRGMLQGIPLTEPVTKIYNPNPVIVRQGESDAFIQNLMWENRVEQIPEVDRNFCPSNLFIMNATTFSLSRANIMVIMAGGRGIRLHPYTEDCPKPMLLIGDKPMLQVIIERAKEQGIKRFILSVNYLAQKIKDHFGDGKSFGVEISYVQEDHPLGTAGALSILSPQPDDLFLVTNGDVLTSIDYGALLDFGTSHVCDGVMAVRQHEWTNPYGVVQTDDLEITGFIEKPTYKHYINAGVYALKPHSLNELQHNVHCDMPDLFEKLRQKNKRVLAYPLHEHWLDVGRPSDLRLANDLHG